MNKNLAILSLILLGMIAISNGQDYAAFWENCQDQLINYSLYFDAHTDQLLPIAKLFNCAKDWYSDDSEGRKKCESEAGLDQFDESIKSFYNDCLKPQYDDKRNKCNNIDSVCASETDKCTSCEGNPNTCKTGSAMPRRSDYVAIKGGDDTNCPDKFAVKCDKDKLKITAQEACIQYEMAKCAKEFYEANFKEDGCYDYTLCQLNFNTSSLLLKSGFISLILAFFAF